MTEIAFDSGIGHAVGRSGADRNGAGGHMRRIIVATVAAACLGAWLAGGSSPVGATRRTADVAGQDVVIAEGQPYTGEFAPFASRAGVNQSLVRAPEPPVCDVAPHCDTIPIKIVEPQASKDGGRFSVTIQLTWTNDSILQVALFDNGQVRGGAGRLPTESETWDPLTYDPQATAVPYTVISGGLPDPRNPNRSRIMELNSQDHQLIFGDYNLVVLYASGVVVTKYTVSGSMSITLPDDQPFEILDPDATPLPFSNEVFGALPQEVVDPIVEADGAVGPLLAGPVPLRPRVLSGTERATPVAAPAVDEGPAALAAVDSTLDPLLQSIKQNSLEDQLAAPPLQVAAAVEAPPVPPSGTSLVVGIFALPVVGGIGFGGFWLRRRSSLRLT